LPANHFWERHMKLCAIESLEGRVLFSTLPAGFSEVNVGQLKTTVAATMAFAPDGRLFVGDTTHSQIRLIKDGKLASDPVLDLPVEHASERGINGIAIDPNFATAPAGQKYVYVYYTPAIVPGDVAFNRLSRFTISTTSADKLDPASEKILIDRIDSPNANHNGGALHFGADGKLYLAIGEGGVPENAQSLANLNGKVLRINSDGTIPADNPFVGVAGARAEIWAYGFRNPFTGAFKPGTNTLYINDVGQASWEEIDVVEKGKNFGWPIAEGAGSDPALVNPIYTYPHNGQAVAITGGTFYEAGQFPSSYKDKYFFADYLLKQISVFDPATKQAKTFATGTLSVVDLDVNPKDGSLWYLDVKGDVQKITYKAPTTSKTLRAAADAYVRDGTFAGQNFGPAAQLQVKKSTSSFNRYSYLRFDLSSVASIATAKLRLFGKLDNTQTKNVPIEIDAVASTTWGENTITWNNKPAVGAALAKFNVIDTTARWYEIDLTSYLKAQKAAGKMLISLALRGLTSVTPDAVFNSDEATTNRPELVITSAAATLSATPKITFADDASVSAWETLQA
jgi:glucose/arabinose dehydrogenase